MDSRRERNELSQLKRIGVLTIFILTLLINICAYALYVAWK